MAIRQRMLKTVSSGSNTLKYFDGNTMETQYQSPPRAYETVFCRANPVPASCEGGQVDLEDETHDLYLLRHVHKTSKNAHDEQKPSMCNVVPNTKSFAHGFVGLPASIRNSCA